MWLYCFRRQAILFLTVQNCRGNCQEEGEHLELHCVERAAHWEHGWPGGASLPPCVCVVQSRALSCCAGTCLSTWLLAGPQLLPKAVAHEFHLVTFNGVSNSIECTRICLTLPVWWPLALALLSLMRGGASVTSVPCFVLHVGAAF